MRYYLVSVAVCLDDTEWDSSCDETHGVLHRIHSGDPEWGTHSEYLYLDDYLEITPGEYAKIRDKSIERNGL